MQSQKPNNMSIGNTVIKSGLMKRSRSKSVAHTVDSVSKPFPFFLAVTALVFFRYLCSSIWSCACVPATSEALKGES